MLRARGIQVTVLTPGPEDLAAMGANVMDPRRRQPVLDIFAAHLGRHAPRRRVGGSTGRRPEITWANEHARRPTASGMR